VFTQEVAKEYAQKYEHLVLISGRYEGIDYRVNEILGAEEVSIGDYVLTGGELPALTIIDATARQIPGVLGTFESLEEERITNGKSYTRPEVLKYKKQEYKVPEVLVQGNHAEIERWRK
jgi:tRNA (guanine37-N1)-methyltransferase